jgi:hypothetical protein
LNVFILPFRLHSMLQLLGLTPSNQWIPNPRSWLPFCGTSVIQLRRENLPFLPFFAYRPISSLVHHYFYLSCRPAIMEPMHPAQRRRSSGSRFANSGNSVHLVEMSNVETPLTNVFRRLFSVIGWSYPPSLTQDNTPSSPWNPGLRRRETWNVNEIGEIEETLIDEVGDVPTTPPNTRRHFSDAQPAPEDQPHAERRPTIQHSPSSSNGNDPDEDAENRLDPGRSDTTIRISSIDPESGTVNLEIGIPEQPGDRHASFTEAEVEAIQRQNRDRLESSGHARRHSSSAMTIYQKPHRVSKLALEPTDMLASLVNSWVAGWFLIPFRAYALRTLVTHILSRPESYSVSTAIADRLSVGHTRAISGYAGKIALCCAVDVCLGLTFWIGEWTIVRAAGTQLFDWGNL